MHAIHLLGSERPEPTADGRRSTEKEEELGLMLQKLCLISIGVCAAQPAERTDGRSLVWFGQTTRWLIGSNKQTPDVAAAESAEQFCPSRRRRRCYRSPELHDDQLPLFLLVSFGTQHKLTLTHTFGTGDISWPTARSQRRGFRKAATGRNRNRIELELELKLKLKLKLELVRLSA